MIRDLLFEPGATARSFGRPSFWLTVAAGITVGYIVFGLIFLGVSPLSRGGFAFAALGALWMAVAVVKGFARFPPVLALPLAYFAYVVVSGLMVDPYPTEYVLRLFTVWIGATAVAFFVANGVSLFTVAGGLVLLCAANLAAILMGYESYLVNTQDFDMESLEGVEVDRSSGLAGQTNKLVGLVYVLPFCTFLFRRREGIPLYAAMLAVCIGTALLTGSRSTLLFTTLFALCGAIWILPRGPIKLVFAALGLAGTMTLATYSADGGLVPLVENTPLGETVLFERAVRALDGDGSTDARADFVAAGVGTHFAEDPIFGHGAGAFADVTGADTYAHNNFAEIAVNGGLVGLVLYYSMYVAIAIGVLRTFPRHSALLAPLAFLMVADVAFVTMVARGMILLLCLTLVVAYALPDAEGRGGRGGGSGGRRRRRRRRA